MKLRHALPAVSVLLFFTVTAHADAVYTYTGNPLLQHYWDGHNYYVGIPSCECSLDGSFTMSQPIGPGNYALL
ncbi:MAG: hypothetical protein ACRD4C_10975 [Candidatus Acidiferrales bacterium]